MLKKSFLEIKDTIMGLKNSIPNLITQAEKCLKKKLKKPAECYVEVNGEITCTPEEKAAWEKDMTKPNVVAKVARPTGGAGKGKKGKGKKGKAKKAKKEKKEGDEEAEEE